MQIIIDGESYELTEAIHRAALTDLRAVKKELGASARTITETFSKFDGTRTRNETLDDDDVLRDLQAMVYLAKRKAGVLVTVAEAGEVSFADLLFQVDVDDEGGTDPKA